MKDIYQDFMTQRRNAVRRNINFNLSFDEWLSIWTKSGKLNLRGKGKGKYHMCRINDIGAYDVNNVYIDLAENNGGLPHKGKSKTLNHKNKISQSLLGKSKSELAIENNRTSQLNRQKYDCPKCNRMISGIGNLKQHIANKHTEILI